MRVRFAKDYDHRWPSRAVTAYKAGFEGAVKREVGEAAVAKGKATEVRNPAKPKGDAAAPTNADLGRNREVARLNDAHDVGPGFQRQIVDGAGQ